MAIFQRKKKDPAADAYRKMAQEAAAKKQYDFIGMTGKMDDEIHHSKKYNKAEQAFKDIISKPVQEDYKNGRYAWYPSDDDESLEILNSTDNEDHKKLRSEWIRDTITRNTDSRVHPRHTMGRILEESPLTHAEKHKIATELWHHDWNTRFDRANYPDTVSEEEFHSTKLPIDRVLEEMTRYRPNAENRERIRQGIDAFKKDNPEIHAYLSDKYQFALTEVPIKPFKKYTPQESILNHEEVMKHKDEYSFVSGRVLAKRDDTKNMWDQMKFQLHPDGTINRISGLIPHINSHDSHPFVDEDQINSADFHHENLHDLHGDHIHNFGVMNDVIRYTSDSRDLNKYLATGVIMNSFNGESEESKAAAHEAQAENLTNAMVNAPPYAHKFSVWSGLSRSNDVGKYAAKKTDEREKLIGHFPAFTSTSLDPRQAQGFAKGKQSDDFPDQDVHDMMRIDIPKAYHRGLYVDKHSNSKGEQEYILDRNTTVEVHPKPLYYVKSNHLYRVWKGRPILSEDDQAEINERSRHAREK